LLVQVLNIFFDHHYLHLSSIQVRSAEWNYDDTSPYGPSNWGNVNANCLGKRQSPININRLTTKPVFLSSRVQIINANKRPTSLNFANDGHGFSMSFNFADGIQPQITGGPLGLRRFTFHGLHMHWMSEHTVNQKNYDAEMHVVFFNSKYASFAEALPNTDGVSVLGVFFYVRYFKFSIVWKLHVNIIVRCQSSSISLTLLVHLLNRQ